MLKVMPTIKVVVRFAPSNFLKPVMATAKLARDNKTDTVLEMSSLASLGCQRESY